MPRYTPAHLHVSTCPPTIHNYLIPWILIGLHYVALGLHLMKILAVYSSYWGSLPTPGNWELVGAHRHHQQSAALPTITSILNVPILPRVPWALYVLCLLRWCLSSLTSHSASGPTPAGAVASQQDMVEASQMWVGHVTEQLVPEMQRGVPSSRKQPCTDPLHLTHSDNKSQKQIINCSLKSGKVSSSSTKWHLTFLVLMIKRNKGRKQEKL